MEAMCGSLHGTLSSSSLGACTRAPPPLELGPSRGGEAQGKARRCKSLPFGPRRRCPEAGETWPQPSVPALSMFQTGHGSRPGLPASWPSSPPAPSAPGALLIRGLDCGPLASRFPLGQDSVTTCKVSCQPGHSQGTARAQLMVRKIDLLPVLKILAAPSGT